MVVSFAIVSLSSNAGWLSHHDQPASAETQSDEGADPHGPSLRRWRLNRLLCRSRSFLDKGDRSNDVRCRPFWPAGMSADDQVAPQVQEQEFRAVIQRIVVLPNYVYRTEYVYVTPEATRPATAAVPAGPAQTSGAAANTATRTTSGSAQSAAARSIAETSPPAVCCSPKLTVWRDRAGVRRHFS